MVVGQILKWGEKWFSRSGNNRGSKRGHEEDQEVPTLGKESLETPSGRKVKRARRSESPESSSFHPDVLPPLPVKVETESPLRKMTSWIGRKTYSIFGYGEEEKSTRNLVSAAAETIQASPPTRLASTGKEEDEVKLIKEVNPRFEAQDTTSLAPVDYDKLEFRQKEAYDPAKYTDPPKLLTEPLSLSLSAFAFTAGSRGAAPIAPGSSQGPRIKTKYERKRENEHMKSPNLTMRLKRGLVSAPKPACQSIYEKFFTEQKKKKEEWAVDYCVREAERELYRQMLESNLGTILPPRASTIRSPMTTKKKALFPTPAPKSPFTLEPSEVLDSSQDRPLTSTVIKELPKPSTSVLDASPVFSQKAKPRVEEVKEKVREEGVCSPGFLAGLRGRYDSNAREKERLIQREIAKRDFHHTKNLEATKDIDERIKKHLSITEVAFDPEAEADLGPVEISPITPAMEQAIREAMSSNERRVLIEEYNIPITVRDLRTLQGLNWLNDEVINFYMGMIVKRSEGPDYPKVWAFSTFFYPKLIDGGHASVKRWSKKVDLFSCSLIFVPVHLGMHWCLAVVDMDTKEINYYDSMGGNNNRCLDALKKYLNEEHKAKKGSPLEMSEWHTNLKKDIPQQMNGSDCGMFACKFSEYLSRRKRISFTQANMPLFRRRMIYEIVKNDLLHP